MLLIWRGWGIVVIGIALVAILGGFLLGAALKLGPTGVGVAGMLALVPAGILTWYLGKWLNRNMDRQVTHPETGQTFIFREAHSLYLIRVEWWGVIMVVAGILFALHRILSTPPAG